MVRIMERKVRERAQQLYDERGREEGYALKDWFQAEAEVLGNNLIGPLYRRLKSERQVQQDSSAELASQDPVNYESTV